MAPTLLPALLLWPTSPRALPASTRAVPSGTSFGTHGSIRFSLNLYCRATFAVIITMFRKTPGAAAFQTHWDSGPSSGPELLRGSGPQGAIMRGIEQCVVALMVIGAVGAGIGRLSQERRTVHGSEPHR